jgi:hypothetical protein
MTAAAETTTSTLALAERGTTNYRVVIAAGAAEGSEYAAKELAYFLHEMTGASFDTVRDDVPASEFEIVLGETQRKSLREIPAGLQPQSLEGFVVWPEKSRLFIIGRVARGTLYGVYDVLEQEFGVRFLAPRVNHIPPRSTLRIKLKARCYDPPLEYRNIWLPTDEVWAVRQRLNAIWGSVPMAKLLGGVRWVGPTFVHTFDSLVPVAQYFDTHPEYFSLIGGERVKEHDGLITQLCVTNPEVLRISLERVREWVRAGSVNPADKLIVGVSINDSPNFCECANCVAVNQDEGVKEGGALIRFVNAIAEAMQREYPAVSVETLGYGTEPPRKTKPAANVIIRWAGVDYTSALDDPRSSNKEQYQQLLTWEKMVGDGHLYNWSYFTDFRDCLAPVSNLRYIDQNLRTLVRHRVNGVFAQAQQSPGTDLYDLRCYLLAQCLWRPETQGRRTLKEFSLLYYGKGARHVLEYVDYHSALNGQSFDGERLRRADAILGKAEAEAAAVTPETKLRVAALRLQPWKFMLEQAFREEGRVLSLPLEWRFKFDADDQGLKEDWASVTALEGWRTMRIDKHWTMQGEERRGIAWYATPFEMPDTRGAPLALSCGAVDGDCEVFIDGMKIGERRGLPLDLVWQQHFFVPMDGGLSAGKHVIMLRVVKPDYNAGIWKPISIVDLSTPIAPELRSAGERFIEVSRAVGMTHISESYAAPWGIQMEKVFYPTIETFLRHRR